VDQLRFEVAVHALSQAEDEHVHDVGPRRHFSLGALYAAALVIALLIAIHHLWIIRRREPAACFRAFLGNHWLGMVMFLGVALDYALRTHRWPHAW
jgi:hypothetical protein